MSAWTIEGPDGRMLGPVGKMWCWLEPDDPRVRVFPNKDEAIGTRDLLPWSVRKGAALHKLTKLPVKDPNGGKQ